MPIGPALPPHLVKRKRDNDHDSESSGSGTEKSKRAKGPSLPASRIENADAVELGQDNSSDDDGPQPAASAIGPILPRVPAEVTPQSRVMGPAMPPPSMKSESNGSAQQETDGDSDSDDDIGPALPPVAGTKVDAIKEFDDTSGVRTDAQSSSRLRRDDWMLAAPSGGDWTGRVDPTKLQSRKFNTNAKSSSSAAGAPGTDMWSETPEQKRRRLQNQVLGVTDLEQEAAQPRRSGRTKEDEEKERRVREYNEKHRGQSLFNQHQLKRDKEEEDDPSKRAFDREKDIAGGTHISYAKKQEMMSKASDIGSRFAKGSYL